MITHSGVHIQRVGGVVGTPTSSDIAIQAARICRFCGAVWSPLLNHLVVVAVMAWDRSPVETRPYNAVWGLLHDAHEVATSDIPRPFKCDCMRVEQAAIDLRLLNTYLGDKQSLVDFDLVKQVDIDACDIEAVQLGLPNYRDLALSNAEAYRGKVVDRLYDSTRDVELFQNVRHEFATVPQYALRSSAVRRFSTALEFAKQGDWAAFERHFQSWGLTR